MVSLRDSIYIIGGLLCHKDRVHVSDETADMVDMGTDVSPRVMRYNIRTNEWFTCGQLGVARYDSPAQFATIKSTWQVESQR